MGQLAQGNAPRGPVWRIQTVRDWQGERAERPFGLFGSANVQRCKECKVDCKVVMNDTAHPPKKKREDEEEKERREEIGKEMKGNPTIKSIE